MVATSSPVYRIQKDNYWAIRADGGIGWIADHQISDKQQPGTFTAVEANYVKGQIPDVQVWEIAPDDVMPPTTPNATQPQPTMTPKSPPKTRRGKLVLAKRQLPTTRTTPQPTDPPRDILEHLPTAFLWILLGMLLIGIGVACSWGN